MNKKAKQKQGASQNGTGAPQSNPPEADKRLLRNHIIQSNTKNSYFTRRTRSRTGCPGCYAGRMGKIVPLNGTPETLTWRLEPWDL